MKSRTDQQLLRDYAERRSEAAFTELVRRHVDLVYSAAWRMVRNAQVAEDVTQGVFVAFAQQARQLTDRPVFSGWLHRTTQNLAANAIRTDVRRRAREQEAVAMNELFANQPDGAWEQIAPHLDAALGELSEADRDALMLRYFERKSAQEMAQLLGVSDAAAQKRVSRAVERLRELFAKRGVTVGSSGLVLLISTNAVLVAPAGLSAAITASALAAVTTAALAGVAVSTVSWFNAKSGAAIAAAALLAGLTVYFLDRHRLAQHDEAARVATVQQQQMTLARDEALAAARASRQEAESLRRDLSELPRLQGEIARLRNQIGLSLVQKSVATTNAEPRKPVLPEPELKALLAKLDPVPLHIIKTRLGETIKYPKTGSDTNAEQAVRDMGTTVLPQLFDFLRTQDTNAIANSRIPFQKTGRFQRWLAVKAFYALGPEAAPAIPTLLNFGPIDGPDDDVAYALAGIGPVAVAPLTEALSNSDQAIRRRATLALGFIGPESSSASATLIERLGNPQETSDVRLAALFALGKTAPDSEQALPVLLKALRDPALIGIPGNVIHEFCTALERYGPRAKSAVPALLELLPRVDAADAVAVRKSLKAIDPQAAAHAGIP